MTAREGGSTATGTADLANCCCDPVDIMAGRLPGARPPLRSWLPAAVFAVVALILTLVVVLIVRAPGALDDPHPADQRDGLLLNGPRLSPQVDGVAFGGHTVVVLFTRTKPEGMRFEAWRTTVSNDGVELVVRLATAGADLAKAVQMPTPVDGGTPVGYAVVDAARQVRYATLDPSYLDNAFEVDVITRAVS